MNSILYQKFESWPEIDKPPFSNIAVIGCCENHEKEGDFKWYREHTWQDFRDYILSHGFVHDLGYSLDPIQFGSFEPKVKRYFMKGSLSVLARQAEQVSLFQELDYYSWGWISYEKDSSTLNKDFFSSIGYSKTEVDDIITLIQNIKNKLKTKNEKEIKSIESTLLFWQTVYDNL